MRATISTSVLCLIVWAYRAEGAAPELAFATPPSPITTVIPNRSYSLKLDCISCPYLIRHSNHNEWEQDPRPNILNLALYIDDSYPHLYLQGESLQPLWYERRAPSFYNLPRPFAPPFTANQIGTNETLQREENGRGYGMPIREFELAYEYDMVTYAPKDAVREWELLIEFEIIGLRHEEHVPKDILFTESRVDKRIQGTIPGVTSVIRVVLGYTESEEMEITALELMAKDGMANVASKEVEALRKAAALKGDKSITIPNWSGRLRKLNGHDSMDMYTDHVSFRPGDWNACGRKDEWGRQIMCKVDDLKAWSLSVFVMSLILVVTVLVGMVILFAFASRWAIRILRGNKRGVTADGENDPLLLYGDEELEEEDEKEEKEIVAKKRVEEGVRMDQQQDGQPFGPYEHNVGRNT